MDKKHIINEIDAIFRNCRDHMKNIPEDWEKVYKALHKVYEKYGRDKWVLEKVLQAYEDLEVYWREKEDVHIGI